MKLFLTLLLITFSAQLFANNNEPLTAGSEQTSMKIQGTKIPCNGTDGNKSCFQVQKGASIGTDFWEVLPEPIAGFNFEVGYTYFITVKITTRENPTGNQSNFIYEMVNVVSKTKD